jgi:hypothetical protein
VFNDEFVWRGAPGKLRFTLKLDGTASAVGRDPGLNTADVDASLLLGTTLTLLGAFGVRNAPGSTTLTVDILSFDAVNLTMELDTGAQ